MRAYTNLISANIPALWRVVSESTEPGKEITLELWVFWFDERHTGKIDANDDLYALDETKVGSFTWENAYSKIQSPTASPIASSAQSNSSTPVTVSDEYRMFVKSIRNLVHVQMKGKGAFPLGEFYIFPNSDQDVIGEDKTSQSNLLNMATSLLCCSYNIYLASTNLIFQPSTRRMRIRPITLQTIRNRGKKVIISPSGETVYIATNNYSLPQQMEENILKKWSLLLDIPYTNLIQPTQRDKQQKKQNEPSQEKSIPNLVAIKISALDETFLYPARLIFISSSSKLSPTAMAGVNGLFGFNQGFTEDLGDKWHRWAWSEKISNYWEYACPRDTTTTTVLDTLSQENNSNSMINLLQKAINEPVIASPLMATKSVATPGSATCQRNDTNISMTPTSSVNEDDDPMTQSYQQPQHQLQQRSKARYQSGLSLVDFAMTHFAMPNSNMDDFPEYPELMHDNTTNTPTLQHPTIKMNENGQQNQKMNHALINSNSIHVNKSMLNISNDNAMTSASNTASNSTYQSPQIPNLELEAFGIVENMDVDNMVLDIPNQWAGDGMDDLDSFDFGVTEEDFDFFESGPAPAPAAPPAHLTAVEPEHTFAENDLMLNNLIKQEAPFDNFETKQLASLNEKQQQHILDTDMDESHDSSVTPLEVGLATQHDHFSFEQQEHVASLQKQHEHHQMFVPPQFAPVKMEFAVNDAKYINGGKFTYTPDTPKTKRRGSDYQPDYIPLVRKKKSERRKSSKLLQDTIQNDNKSLSIIEDAHASTHSLSSTSVSSTEESSTEDEEYSENESEDEASRVTRTFKALCRAQNKFVAKLTSLSPSISLKKKLSLEKMVMDYDSPFARTIASSVIRLDPKKYQDLYANEDFQALDFLCQQVVMGGYPFSGGIESMSSNGFEANEGESAKVVVARRRNLLQKFNGDVVHIPSTPSDVDYMTQNFKNVLSDIFFQRKSTDINDMCLDQLPLPASVTVKGPLNVQQYYDLSETNQTHSKYGKYQVKKRRPAEPNLDTLQPPNITISRQEDLIEGSSKLIMLWEKLRLEPYSCKKHINYFVVYPKNDTVESNVSHFLKGLSTLYETCQLGVHHPGNISHYRRGLAPVPLLPKYDDESMDDRQLRSYMVECQNLGSALGGAMAENVHIVIYLVNPASHLSSNLDLSRCFSKLTNAFNAAAMGTRTTEKTRARLVLQLMPIEHILRSTSFGGCLKFGLKEIAFSVYSKCHAVVGRHHTIAGVEDTRPITEMYAPPFILSKPMPTTIPFQLKKALNAFSTILETPAVLHMGYCFSFDKRWMIIVWTDNCGELVEFTILDNQRYSLPLVNVFEEAWAKTKDIAKRAGFAWTFVIAKIGLVFEEELQAWIQCVSNEEKVAIVSLDMESTLYVSPTSDTYMNDASANTAETLGTNTHNMMNASASSTAAAAAAAATAASGGGSKKMFVDVDTYGSGQTKALLLNHRVAYSNKRERASYGILDMDPISQIEDWMIPLASGYMIHTPPSTENPNNELFNCNPLVIEIHLVYNQTNHSAYSTLRDIIKKYHALSYVNVMPSNSNCFPIHLALVERLSRILLVVNT
ncbi:mediator complex subunit 13 C-terminal-domain-containing protein [Mucor mucedo]|uniref:mediator complex subunit 13 C-terminal-domain-containing protein n=1 Tax=Mucor mucedo TaxID=29922 RepID=UPI00221F5F52|nr:mediator complex subunit 13 C-terminal-domain-containing protein [Mucor mucedo]KAI7892992.1 mediator complex subunit 13 C-terminal-domain-containing protein [Mucor mucedo]